MIQGHKRHLDEALSRSFKGSFTGSVGSRFSDRVQASGFGVQGLRFGVWSLRFWVLGITSGLEQVESVETT